MSVTDNPSHANGTCEACGGPCAVYGCRYCPDCYWPATLAERDASRGREDNRPGVTVTNRKEPQTP